MWPRANVLATWNQAWAPQGQCARLTGLWTRSAAHLSYSHWWTNSKKKVNPKTKSGVKPRRRFDVNLAIIPAALTAELEYLLLCILLISIGETEGILTTGQSRISSTLLPGLRPEMDTLVAQFRGSTSRESAVTSDTFNRICVGIGRIVFLLTVGVIAVPPLVSYRPHGQHPAIQELISHILYAWISACSSNYIARQASCIYTPGE